VRFAWARWVNNERLLLSLHYADKRRGIDSLETRLVSVRYDGSAEVNMVRKAPGERFMRQIQDEVIDWMPEDGRHVLMQWQERPNSIAPAVYRVDVETAEFHLVHGSHPRVGRWWSDRTHRVRVGLFSDADAIEVRACDADGSNWRSLWRFERESIDVVRPLGFGADPNQLFIEADLRFRGKVKCLPDEPRESRNEFIGARQVRVHYILLNGVQTVKNKMRVHLRLARQLLQFAHTFTDVCFFPLPFPDAANDEGYHQTGHCQE
jgi:hypothetical protein